MNDNDNALLVKPSDEKGYVLLRIEFLNFMLTENNLLTEGSKKYKCSNVCLNLGARRLLDTIAAYTQATKK
jgi:hypothetical protein